MRLKSAQPQLLLLLAALSLAACASRNAVPAYEHLSSEDDDAFCRKDGKVAAGSPEYVYCRRDRDAARNLAIGRADRKQRDLADYMMAHPDHP
jgi:hypothetical protein